MTMQEWENKIGEKVLNGECVWMDTLCRTRVALVKAKGKYKKWIYHVDKKTFTEE